jgi:hypothetical protein
MRAGWSGQRCGEKAATRADEIRTEGKWLTQVRAGEAGKRFQMCWIGGVIKRKRCGAKNS